MGILRVRIKTPDQVSFLATTAQVKAAVTRRAAEAAVQRVQRRVQHEAAETLTVKLLNQHAARISGPRGGRGIIRPVTAQSLRFIGRRDGAVVFAKQVRGRGLGPLIGSELKKVDASELDTSTIVIK